jgi:type VI secretion system protein ImpJ
MGQTLLPEHLRAQEESLVADATLRFRSRGLPPYGIARLKWNDMLIAEGVLSIQALTMIMNSGLLLDVPANAAASPFNLNAPGAAVVPVYCHVMRDDAPEAEPGEISSFHGDNVIARSIRQLILSFERTWQNALETIKLAEFEKDPDGIWRLSSDFIPPLLEVGASPFLKVELEELAQMLESFHYKLTQEIAASYLSGDSLLSAKSCLKEVLIFKRFLANLFSQIHCHPYYVVEELTKLYTEVCFYRNVAPESIATPYDHDRLAAAFKRLLASVQEQMHMVQKRATYLPFELRDGVYRIALPKEAREAKEVYLLVQKDQVNRAAPVKDLKMGCLSRLPLIHKLALQGIPFKKIDRPPFQHTFGPEVDIFQILSGEEWDHALRELSAAFYSSPRIADTRFYFFWRIN